MAIVRLDDALVDLFFVFLLAMLALLAVATIRNDVIEQQLLQVSFIQDQAHLVAIVQGSALATDRTSVNGLDDIDALEVCLRTHAFPAIGMREQWETFQQRTGFVVKQWEAGKFKPMSARYDLMASEQPMHLVFEMCCVPTEAHIPYPHPVQLQLVDSRAALVLQDLSFAFDGGGDPNTRCLHDTPSRLVELKPLGDHRVRTWHVPACRVAVVTLEP